jgi:2-polyprenyl-3-methyl-5-hydroxy-6-metoxy-1,4-benzoquinol methylase
VVSGLRNATIELRHRANRRLTSLTAYKPLENGRHVFDTQYAGGQWDYLRSPDEAPRYGVVAGYTALLPGRPALLEVGCGEGPLLDHLDRHRTSHFTGIDISSVAIDRARSREDENVRFHCAEAESFAITGTFDAIVFNEMLYYLPEPLRVVRRFEHALSPGGWFIVSMFAGLHTGAARHIWKGLGRRYEVVAHARIRTRRSCVWDVKVLTVPTSA